MVETDKRRGEDEGWSPRDEQTRRVMSDVAIPAFKLSPSRPPQKGFVRAPPTFHRYSVFGSGSGCTLVLPSAVRQKPRPFAREQRGVLSALCGQEANCVWALEVLRTKRIQKALAVVTRVWQTSAGRPTATVQPCGKSTRDNEDGNHEPREVVLLHRSCVRMYTQISCCVHSLFPVVFVSALQRDVNVDLLVSQQRLFSEGKKGKRRVKARAVGRAAADLLACASLQQQKLPTN